MIVMALYCCDFVLTSVRLFAASCTAPVDVCDWSVEFVCPLVPCVLVLRFGWKAVVSDFDWYGVENDWCGLLSLGVIPIDCCDGVLVDWNRCGFVWCWCWFMYREYVVGSMMNVGLKWVCDRRFMSFGCGFGFFCWCPICVDAWVMLVAGFCRSWVNVIVVVFCVMFWFCENFARWNCVIRCRFFVMEIGPLSHVLKMLFIGSRIRVRIC